MIVWGIDLTIYNFLRASTIAVDLNVYSSI